METKSCMENKLQMLFDQLRVMSGNPIEDDTVIEKLQSSLQNLIDNKKNSIAWCDSVGLIAFISDTLEEEYIKNEKNSAIVTFALHCLSSIVRKELRFNLLSHNKVILNYKNALPYVHDKSSVTSSALKVVNSLVSHNAGFSWVIENNIWENLLIRSLGSQNIFIRRACMKAICDVILNVKDAQIFGNCIRDLELILYKVREVKHKFYELSETEDVSDNYEVASAIAKLKFNTQTMVLVFHSLLYEALGKRSLYSQMKPIFDLTSKVLFRFNFSIHTQGIKRLFRLLLLSTIHRFQDMILKFGTAEQFHLDSITSDILSLTRHMINKGFHNEFLEASFDVHRYWDIMCKNINERNDAELSKCEAVLQIFIRYQLAPFRAICSKSLLDMGTEEYRKSFEDNYELWRTDMRNNIVIREEHKLEMYRLIDLLSENSSGDLNKANEQCITNLIHSASVIQYFHPICASYMLQVLIFVLKFKIEATSDLESNSRFYLHAIDILRTLIENYEIDWKNCYESKSLVSSLCSIIWIPGINIRVKVVSLQTLRTCIRKFIPPLTTSLELNSLSSEKIDEAYLDELGKTISLYLSDMEWEVRDSALELILTCMTVPEEKHEPFVNWFLKFNLLDHILQAIGDIEPYVQATALNILATIVPVDKIWCKVNEKDVKQKTLRGIVMSGENSIRKSGFLLLQSLLLNSKFKKDEISKFVIPIVQSATSDSDDEVRLLAVTIIRQHLDIDLRAMGMVDGGFPKMTFQCGKITNLEEREVENRVLSVITNFCENGYILGVCGSIDDNVAAVSSEAVGILKFIESLLDKYNLRNKLPSDSVSETEKNTAEVEASTDVETTNASSLDNNQEIDNILKTSDLAVITKLKNDDSSNISHLWWDGGLSDVFLKEDVIPRTSGSTSRSSLMAYIKKAYEINNDIQIDYENEIDVLLDDIFLVTGSSQTENESRSRDCY